MDRYGILLTVTPIVKTSGDMGQEQGHASPHRKRRKTPYPAKKVGMSPPQIQLDKQQLPTTKLSTWTGSLTFMRELLEARLSDKDHALHPDKQQQLAYNARSAAWNPITSGCWRKLMPPWRWRRTGREHGTAAGCARCKTDR